MKQKLFLLGIVFILSIFLCSSALAVPSLQLYIDGATYDTESETWIYPGLIYDLWAIGADNHEGVTIEEVKLAAAVKTGQIGDISIQPYLDDGTLGAALEWIFYEDSIPVKGDGRELQTHGIYPSDYYLFQLGDFILNDRGIPDYTEGYDPEAPVSTNNYGKEVQFHVTVTGGYDWVHFDLFDHIEGDNHAIFAPFSHDADAEDGGDGGSNPIPEPATMLLLGTGLIGVAGIGRKKLGKKI